MKSSSLIKVQRFFLLLLHLLSLTLKIHIFFILFFKHHHQLAYVYIQVYTLKIDMHIQITHVAKCLN
jgi:hypothetical protein